MHTNILNNEKNAGHSSSQSKPKKVFNTRKLEQLSWAGPWGGPEAWALPVSRECHHKSSSPTEWSARNPESRWITHQTVHKLSASLVALTGGGDTDTMFRCESHSWITEPNIRMRQETFCLSERTRGETTSCEPWETWRTKRPQSTTTLHTAQ